MKLIKIKEDHYIIVDETIQPVNGWYYDNFINKIRNTNGAEYGESIHCWQITHSTQALEKFTYENLSDEVFSMDYHNIKPLSLQEVKENFCWLDGTEWEVELVDGKLKLK